MSVATPLVFNPADEAVRRDSFAVFARLRDEDPVHWSPALKTWVVTRYDDVRDVAITADLSPNRLAPFYASLKDERRSMLAEVMRYVSVWLVFRESPEHTRLRRLLNGVVNPQRVAAMRPSIRRVVDEVLDRLAGRDQIDPREWHEYYRRAGEAAGKPFAPGAGGGTVFMDTYAMQAAWHMRRWETSAAQIAAGASKNHAMGARNPLAQYRFGVSPEQVLADRLVSAPLTGSMCAPIGDGAAAALLCSASMLATLPPRVRERAVKVRASVLTGGKYRSLDEPGLSRPAAQRAYAAAGIGPADVDLAEVHDATSFCEIYQSEMLGFCENGAGGAYVASGASALDGERPINQSGGLVSKSHPVGATGLSMVQELALQLCREAGERQARHAELALAENGGGVIGFDEAVCSVIVLQAPSRGTTVGGV